MAQPKLRSMNHELLDGSCDGTYRKIAPNRTNIQFPDLEKIRNERRDLAWPYGVDESRDKTTPDGRFVRD